MAGQLFDTFKDVQGNAVAIDVHAIEAVVQLPLGANGKRICRVVLRGGFSFEATGACEDLIRHLVKASHDSAFMRVYGVHPDQLGGGANNT